MFIYFSFDFQRVFFVRCDVRSEEDFRRAWEEAESGSGLGLRVTLLVNNAGVNPEGGWRRCVDVCFMGVAVGTYLALEKMDKTKVPPHIISTCCEAVRS